ncbi:MAG: YebC/PmpR family DNA-binding transcriptional regulator, partial [Vallitaleaceae bacterium]|nr:YebC/PmpR family DNA-binding transcriptional regulator [Vallitaleaceae bacterium]
SGCVSFMFEQKGQIVIEKEGDIDEDALMMMALDAGAEDVISEEEGFEIITAPDAFTAVYDVLAAAKIEMLSAEITMIAATTTDLTAEEDIKNLRRMLDQLEDDDDVQNVYSNWGNEE